MDQDSTMRLIYLGVLAAAVAGWAYAEMRGNLGRSLRFALIWALIGVGLVAGYGLWDDLRRGLMGGQAERAGGVVSLPRAADGHYYAEVTLGGQPLRLLVDTGASTIVLTRADAARIGIDPERLAYTGQALTANGTVRTATVTLPELALGPYRDAGLAADVTDGALDVSLLGMSYLSLFRVTVLDARMELSR
ncbi:MAG: retropepsin-like aspartic protease family protein [Paracoccaceae bacterium]